jgi:hypothetical protein
MKKVITFTEDQVLQMKYMLNAVTVTGIQNAKQVAAIAQVLESGMPGEVGTEETVGACTARNNASPARTGGEV